MKRGELRLHVREAAVKRVERQHGRARSSCDRTVLLRQSLRLLPERRSRAGSARWEGNAHRGNGASYKGEETPTPNKGVPPHGPRKLADPLYMRCGPSQCAVLRLWKPVAAVRPGC